MTVRRRITIARSGTARAGTALCGLLALAVAWCGGAGVALALGADPAAIDGLTGYRDATDWLAHPPVPDERTRAIVAGAGLLVFLVAGRLALAQIPRPRVQRSAFVLEQTPHGTTTVAPRAIERAVEGAVAQLDGVGDALARWEPGAMTVHVTGARARSLTAALTGSTAAAGEALARHGLPTAEVQVVLRRVRSDSTREVS